MTPPSGQPPRPPLPLSLRAAAGAILLCLSVSAHAASPDNGSAAATLEQRAAVEKASRSRYRDLEIASLVLILAGGGAAIWWTLRRK